MGSPASLEGAELRATIDYWNAANYLTVAQIYLAENALLRKPLEAADIKPRLLGHWGTSPGLNLVYVHLNRLIKRTGQQTLYIAGPGHGGPALVANVYLEGTYSEIYPHITPDAAGVRALARQFSTPDGIPSHVSVPTPGSIHEGGELGYALIHAFGAAMDHPDLLVACVVGDGEAETGPLEGSWKGTRFLNPKRDGAVLPILHLNSYKIANPTVLGRTHPEDVRSMLHGHGYEVFEVGGSDVEQVHRDFAAVLDECHSRIRAIQDGCRAPGAGPLTELPRWPAIVMRTPKGWTGPREVDGVRIEGTFRSHQVPLSKVRENPEHLRILEQWMRSYQPDRLFDSGGHFVPELAALAPEGDLRMGATPYANGGLLATDLDLPDWRKYAVEVDPARRGSTFVESPSRLGQVMRDLYVSDPHSFRVFSPDELTSNRLGAVLEVSDRCMVVKTEEFDDRVSPEGRVMEVLSEHLCQGWLEAYTLSGRHGLFATYEAFAMVSASMLVQHAKWLQEAEKLSWRAPVPSLNILLTSTCWRNDHNGFSHQGPGLLDTVMPLGAGVVRAWLPPDGNCLLSIANHCFKSRDHVNLIVADKQPHLQYLTAEEAEAHCARGGSVWEWAGTEKDNPESPVDIVLACIGDVPTMEMLAAAQLLREWVPSLVTRVVNIVDLMAMMPQEVHPHGFSDTSFRSLFGTDEDVVVAFHGYARSLHGLLPGRLNQQRFHTRGFRSQGTTTTPFDMVVRNEMSRYHLAQQALRRSKRLPPGSHELNVFCDAQLQRHREYVVEHFEDLPEIRDWTWS